MIIIPDSITASKLEAASGKENLVETICPYLGTLGDPETRYSFPEWQNTCFKVDPPQPVSTSHQEHACVHSKYSKCPVFGGSIVKGSLPKGIGQEQPERHRHWTGLVLPVVAILSLIVITSTSLFSNFFPLSLPSMSPALIVPVVTQMPTIGISPAFFATLPVPSATRVFTQTPSQTPRPTVTMTIPVTASPGPALETPFGLEGRYLVHQVLEGESAELLAARYATTTEVLKALNFPQGNALYWAGMVIVIQPGQRDPSQVKPIKAIFIETKTRVEDIAKTYGVDIEEFRAINGLNGDWVEAGRWVIANSSN